jgi:hypothetical protein
MMQYDTAGNPIIFYDQCAFCTLDTGGGHQLGCPYYQCEEYRYWTEDELKLLMHSLPQKKEQP